MKNILLVLFTLLFQSIIFADPSHTPGKGPLPPDTGGGVDSHTPGKGPQLPIDANKAILVITATLIAGIMGYKKVSLKEA